MGDRNQIIVPDSAIKYILYQRTSLLHLAPSHPFWSYLQKVAGDHLEEQLYKVSFGLEARLRRGVVKRGFNRLILNDYNQIAPFLPRNAFRILDIGCGVAGIDVLLDRHYRNEVRDFYLVDKTAIENEVFYGFHERGAFYNSLAAARNLLKCNGVDESKIHLLEIGGTGGTLAIHEKVEVCISLLSWGFHYPIHTYLASVKDLLKENGRLIVDVRKETRGEHELEMAFRRVEVILENEKMKRLAITA